MGRKHTKQSPARSSAPPSPPRLADERAYLYGIIRTIGSGPDLRSILSGVVRLATEATQCHACLIWLRDGDRLVLRGSSEPYAALADRIGVDLGEGLVGWVALTRRSAFIEENALADPRVKYFPEFDEEHFQSLVSVPMFDREGEVMGVISLHAEAPHEFAREDLEFLEHTASLIAGAAQNARLYEESAARVDMLTALSRLSRRIAAADGVHEVLADVGRGTRELLGASVCEIFLADAEGRLCLAAGDPGRTLHEPIDSTVLGQRRHAPSAEDSARLAGVVWGTARPEGTALFEPLTVGDDLLGWLAVDVESPPPGATTALSAIAAHAAVAIRQLELVERLLEKNLVSEFFRALRRPGGDRGRVHALATKLSVRLDADHVVVVFSPWSDDPASQPAGAWNDVAAGAESLAASAMPGAWLDRTEHSVRALAPATDGVDGLVREIDALASSTGSPPLSIGISDPCADAEGYPVAFDEAEAAAEIGGLLRRGPGAATFSSLGAYRYLLKSPDLGRDADRRRLDRLSAYDRRRGTMLLDTLERYLDERGNVVGTARALFIHPNTLRQRLERIERESGLDLERDDWLSLAIAVKVVRLEQMRRRTADVSAPQ